MTAYYLPAIESKGSWVASCSMMTRRARLPTSTVCSDSYGRTCSTAPNVASLPRICSRADRFVELCEYQESSVGGRSSREKRRSARQGEPPPFMRSAAGATKSNSNWTEWHVSRSCAKNSNANTMRGANGKSPEDVFHIVIDHTPDASDTEQEETSSSGAAHLGQEYVFNLHES